MSEELADSLNFYLFRRIQATLEPLEICLHLTDIANPKYNDFELSQENNTSFYEYESGLIAITLNYRGEGKYNISVLFTGDICGHLDENPVVAAEASIENLARVINYGTERLASQISADINDRFSEGALLNGRYRLAIEKSRILGSQETTYILEGEEIAYGTLSVELHGEAIDFDL